MITPLLTAGTVIALWSVPTVPVDPLTKIFTDFSFTEQGLTVAFSAPMSWGKLLKPQTDAASLITAGRYKKRTFGVPRIGLEEAYGGRVFSRFPYFRTVSKIGSSVAPTIAVGRFRATYDDDLDLGDPGTLTGVQKAKIFAPLLDMSRKRGITSLPLTQMKWLDPPPERETSVPAYQGAWWGNTDGFITDRIAPAYLENGNRSLRGVGFFSLNSTKEEFRPVYRVILINPNLLHSVSLTFPLEGFPELERFAVNRSLPEQQMRRDLSQGYAYLHAPRNYVSTELGKFMKHVRMMVRTLKVSEL